MRPPQVIALTLVLLLHGLFALLLWREMQPKSQPPATAPDDNGRVLLVNMLDHPGTSLAPQPSAPPTPPAPPSIRQAAPTRTRLATPHKPRRDAMAAQTHPAPAATTASTPAPSLLKVFNQDGSVRLPPPSANAPTTASTETKPAKPTDDRQIMQHDLNRLHYKATRFEKYFPPPNETAGGAVGRHIGDTLKKIAQSVCDPHKRSTATNLLCGTPPIPPSPKDGDERLSMPPPSLVGDPYPDQQVPLSTCIAEYRATKPLSSGCPIDTPDLAFKAEMRECIDLFRAGKRLKPWCPADTPRRAAAESAAPAAAASARSR